MSSGLMLPAPVGNAMVSDYCVRWISGYGRTSAAVGDYWFFCHTGNSEGFWG